MDISTRKLCKRIAEPIDEWLHGEGYFRKHAPRDSTCLFRAISEQVYLTQNFHIRVREECIKFMRDNKDLFEESISIPFESYLEQMSYFTEWGGLFEIKAMSLLYQRDIILFHGVKLTRQLVTHNGFNKMIYLCHIPPKQYETVYARDFISVAAFCQSIVYQTLYKDVFGMVDVEKAVFKMLHDRSGNVSHDKFFLKENLEIREQLTMELFNKLEKTGEDEGPVASTKDLTPFPYRIAKALDPDIYRNTDFDIWQEIKREIRNASWMRYNSSELQVGGKCFVHMDTTEDETDKNDHHTNYTNNNTTSIKEKSTSDNNGNEQKSVNKKSGKKDPIIFSGHIQEMSKNEGPVVVFIEELGEKKTVPYSSLKPHTPKKNKQPNWSTNSHKKNNIFDSGNQKWKRSWYGNSRKMKDFPTNVNSVSSNQTDKNNNKIHHEDTNQWDDESRHSNESPLSYKTYTMERLTAYQGYTVNTSIDVMPVSVVLDTSHPPVTESLRSDGTQPDENPACDTTNTCEKLVTANDPVERQVPSTPESTIVPEIVLQNCNRDGQNEVYYPPQAGMSQYLTGNGNVYYPAADCNIGVPSPQFFISNGFISNPPTSVESVYPANQIMQSVNTSAPKSMDPNGSDLPLSDLSTVRFFYNLGLEYYQSHCSWIGCSMSTPMSLGTCYIPQGSPINQYNRINNLAANEGLTLNDEILQLNQNLQPKLVISQQQEEQTCSTAEFSVNDGKGQNKTVNQSNQGLLKQMGRMDSQTVQDNRASPHTALVQQSAPYSPAIEKGKDSPLPNKDTQRGNRNSVAPRFKKNYDGRYRTSRQYHHQQQQQQSSQIQQQQLQHQHKHQQPFQSPPNTGSIDVQATKNNGTQNLHNAEGQPVIPHNHAANAGSNPVFHSPMNQVPYSQPPIYTAIPYYPTDTDSTFQHPYYPSNPGFPVPYIPHSDITDGNNINHYPPNIYPGGESYAQPYPVFSQYMYPTGMYPALSPQTNSETWYPIPGQTPTIPVPHYVQYSPPATSLPSSPNGPQSSNVSK
ncbi:protein ovarian tumor locus-like [Athalia rosae]|uniref:protein ovarian tumor locus-like n=1 Tax=Athalia rosae TaxID=37344 RepID=UPI0020334B33|nr:protein ovarian tumor locus-like [Athalia rosae]XP_048509758.1 protein ovarian tumor locus-like [Athalia rosae]XP_048509764.1 protein ovarian tumor locus-like [Athalia rosae]XP_048509769.1 protein ovarian tumor locus-like [Athalia rosae]